MSKPDKTLRLHTDDSGIVWYGDCRNVAKSTGRRVAEYIGDAAVLAEVGEAKSIRMLGTAKNALLITGLRTKLGTEAPIIVASPQICKTKQARRDPTNVLHALWQPEASSRLPGSWHALGDFDLATYAMWVEFTTHKTITSRLTAMAHCHPAWKAISFIPDYSEDAGCRLLMYIVDPRWFLHPSKPHRFSRLHNYLGLTPCNAKCLLRDKEPGKNYERAVAAFSTWYTINAAQQYLTGEATDPEHFLWRIFRKQQSNVHGLIAASKRLVDLVAFVWLDAVKVAQADRLFNPSMFFRHSAEYVAFQKHADAWMV